MVKITQFFSHKYGLIEIVTSNLINILQFEGSKSLGSKEE